MNRKDFFRTLIGGAAVAAGVSKSDDEPKPNMIKGFISFDDDPYERIAPGAFEDSIDQGKYHLMNHDTGKSIGRIIEVSHTRDGIGFTYVQDRL
jgi:hypothetical protein